MKIIASLKKSEPVRFISHLDVQRNLQRTIRRADIPVAYSQGFNPHPQISFATALSVGQTGSNEWIEIKLAENATITLQELVTAMNANFPQGMSINHAYQAVDGVPSIATLMYEAQYTAYTQEKLDSTPLNAAIDSMLSGEIIITKAKKQGGRRMVDAQVDIRPMVYSFSQKESPEGTILSINGRLDSSGGLNADKLLSVLNEKLGIDINWHISRDRILLRDFGYSLEYHV